MGFMFCDLHVSLNNPSSGDINSSNLPCLKHVFDTCIWSNTVKPHLGYLQVYSLCEVTPKICIRYSSIRVESGNFGHQVNLDTDIVSIIF